MRAKSKVWKSNQKRANTRVGFLNLLFFVCGAALMALGRVAFSSASPEPNPTSAPAAVSHSGAGKLPAWGEIEITPIVLDRPDAVFESKDAPAPPIRWVFENRSEGQVAELIRSCDLTQEQRNSLLDTNRWQRIETGWRISPSLDVVRDLSSPARERIYSVLAQSPENVIQRFPFVYRSDGFEQWISGCELSAENIELVRRLCYIKEGRLCFADSQLFELLTSQRDAMCLIKTLSRVPTMLVRLWVRPDSNVEELAQYWALGRNAEVKRLLKSLSRVPEGANINISYFMPGIPRLRLYAYPNPTNAVREDCVWTSLNFDNDQPDNGFRNPEYSKRLLESKYSRIQGEKRFGDLLVLVSEPRDFVVHMCVYVAEDIVYTKNGHDVNEPWVLMRMKDVMATYGSKKPEEWRVYRKKAI